MDLQASDWIALFNGMATLVLSFFVYKATVKSANAAEISAEASQKAVELTERINENQLKDTKEYLESLRIQCIESIIINSKKIRIAFSNPNNYNELVEKADKLLEMKYSHNISPENLARCFSKDCCSVINQAWQELEELLGTIRDDQLTLSPAQKEKLCGTAKQKSIEFAALVKLMEKLKKENS